MASVSVYLVCTADRYELPVAEFATSAAAASFIGCSPEMVRLNLFRQRHYGARHRIGVWHRGARKPFYIERVPLDDGQLTLFPEETLHD